MTLLHAQCFHLERTFNLVNLEPKTFAELILPAFLGEQFGDAAPVSVKREDQGAYVVRAQDSRIASDTNLKVFFENGAVRVQGHVALPIGKNITEGTNVAGDRERFLREFESTPF